MINELYDTMSNCGKENLKINGLTVYKGDYGIIKIGETDTFDTEFKFSKTNYIRKFLYNDLLSKITEKEETEFINNINEKFSEINAKINNKITTSTPLKFITEFEAIDKIIEKFTNIYINNIEYKENEISQSMKRILLFKFIFLILEEQTEETILLIDGVDNYLNGTQLSSIITTIHSLKPNVKVIMTANNSSIYKKLYNRTQIYKVNNGKLYNLNNINSIINLALIQTQHNSNSNIPFDSYYEQNIDLISQTDIDNFIEKYVLSNLENIGSLFVNNSIILSNKYIETFENFIIYKDEYEKTLYEIICYNFGIDIF